MRSKYERGSEGRPSVPSNDTRGTRSKRSIFRRTVFLMAVCGVLLLTCALWDTLLPGLDARSFGVVCLGFILSRALSGMAVATFPLAKESGLVHTFATGADKRGVALVDGGLAALAGLGMALLAPVPGCCALLGASLALLHYSLVCRDFGGTTGDLAGYFLELCELAVLLGVTLGTALEGGLG